MQQHTENAGERHFRASKIAKYYSRPTMVGKTLRKLVYLI